MTQRIDVPASEHAVFTSDGRVFYDLSELLSVYTPIVEGREKGAVVFKDESLRLIASGQRMLIDAIAATNDALRIEEFL
jgi:hypothetical protein